MGAPFTTNVRSPSLFEEMPPVLGSTDLSDIGLRKTAHYPSASAASLF
jgi:hypothetical protein